MCRTEALNGRDAGEQVRSDDSYGSDCANFTIDDLRHVRRMVTDAGVRVGLGAPAMDDFVVAVNEVVINAVAYGGGTGSIMVAQAPDGVHVTVQDTGPGLPPGPSGQRPRPDSTGGRGLWLARRLSGRFTLISSPRGVTVWLFAPVRVAAA